MKLQLQARFTLVLLALISTIVITLSSVLLLEFDSTTKSLTRTSSQVMEENLQRQLQKRAELMTRLLAENLINAIYLYDTDAMYNLLKPALEQTDVSYIYIYGTDGELLHDGSKTLPAFGTAMTDKFSRQIPNIENSIFQITEDIIDVATPITMGDMRLGAIRIGFTFSGIQHDINAMRTELREIEAKRVRQTLIWAILSAVALMIIGTTLTVLASRRLVLPIRQLANYATQIGHGNYAVDIGIKRKDELGELADAFRDMSFNLSRTTNEIRHLAYHDSLTNLPNRLMFHQHLGRALANAKRENQLMAVLFLDLDNFKRINDTLGHDAGDELLREFAKRLATCIREEDCVGSSDNRSPTCQMARLGGDEFTIVLPSIHDPMNAATVAGRIQAIANQPFHISGHDVFVSASIGITIYPTDGEDVESLLRNADLALYHVKESGKDGYKYFTDSMNVAANEKLTIENNLRQALDYNKLELYYQPIFDNRTHAITAVEVLLRWNHPQHGPILPEKFIPIAESSGLIVPIGEWVFQSACRQAQEWHDAGMPPVHVAVNVSSVQFRSDNLLDVIDAALKDSGLAAEYLHIELTETSLLHNEAEAAEMLQRISALGVSIWMDDFGTGYSSLLYLRRFPISGVKIDQRFLTGIGSSHSDDSKIVSAIIAMAHSLDLGVIAEGVEHSEQIQWLHEYRCYHLQGNLLGAAMSSQNIKRILEDTNKLELT